jgi:ATP-dependent exoDNAse (exonuclease V) beta subunit
MGAIKIISASAGTGKTYTIAEQLCRRIMDGTVRPDAVLATTFTNKAADELKSRIRVRLVRAGLADSAQRLEASLIGTVNSVCDRLVREYAFELGLSPDLKVLDEAVAPVMLSASIEGVMTVAERQELYDLGTRMADFDWLAEIQRIISLARSNRLTTAVDFQACADRSVEGFMKLFPSPAGNAVRMDAVLNAAIGAFLAHVIPGTVKKATIAMDLVRSMSRPGALRNWDGWRKLTGVDAGKDWASESGAVKAAALEHLNHPLFRADCERVIRLVFDVAARALVEFQRSKRERGVLDFVDQEAYALELLDRPDVQERLRESLDLVLVDEFQDTSPIQLAIFLKLAELAKQSVWVGDQKQSIYGFRGTDPSLMDAVIARLEADGTHVEVLSESWRSRPPLVDLTSDLFAGAFPRWKIPVDRVRIKAAAALGADDPELGPVLEHWVAEGGNVDKRAGQVASGVRTLLADKTVVVRDPVTGVVRPVRAGDVAVLCGTNAQCDKIAGLLANAGTAARRASAGLCATTEGRYILAGMRYYVDPRDSLAVAGLARMVEHPDDGGKLLDELLLKPGAEAFLGMEVVRSIHEAREGNKATGPLAVFDLVTNALKVRERCLEWGDAHLRLDNVDALRTLTVEYIGRCESEGKGCTPAGLLAHLDDLEEEEKDLKALLPGADAVSVETWHSSKGREWPVVILYGLESDRQRDVFGVNAFGPDKVDVTDPLAGRWIGYWPFPYPPAASKAALCGYASNSPAGKTLAGQSQFEGLRLLYVMWTRARDRLVLVTKDNDLSGGMPGLLCDATGTPLLSVSGETEITVAGKPVTVVKRCPGELVVAQPPASMTAWFVCPDAAKEHAPEFVLPSGLKTRGTAGKPETAGDRMVLNGNPDMSEVGNAIHGFLAADRVEWTGGKRLTLAGEILLRYGVAGALAPEAVVVAADNLEVWIKAKWPGAPRHREWPVMMRLEDGSTLKGTADLVLETDGGYVIIDHKTFPGSCEQAVVRAGEYAGQLQAYADAVSAATGKPVLSMYIHLPVGGMIIPVIRAG